MNRRNFKLSPLDKRKCREVYNVPLSLYPLGLKVRVKSEDIVKEDYNIVQRDDFFDWMRPYCG